MLKNPNVGSTELSSNKRDSDKIDLSDHKNYVEQEQKWLNSGDYDDLYKTVKDQAKEIFPDGPCKQYTVYSKVVSTLLKMHETYTPRPCISGYPCLFNQNRTIIRAKTEEMKNEAKRAGTACELKVINESIQSLRKK